MNLAAEAADELRAEGSATESLGFADTTLVGCLPHTTQLRRRLDFLRFILNNSAAELSCVPYVVSGKGVVASG